MPVARKLTVIVNVLACSSFCRLIHIINYLPALELVAKFVVHIASPFFAGRTTLLFAIRCEDDNVLKNTSIRECCFSLRME